MLAHAALALYLVVRVYDSYGLPPQQLAEARTTAARILDGAGVEIRWRDCPCAGPVGPVELVVRVTPSTAESEPGSLGFSYVDVDRRAGTLATVYGDRVHALAAASHADEGELLGRAMAHEVGHLVLGTHQHERQGLLRATWTTIELEKNQATDWMLSSADGRRLRSALTRRIRSAQAPDAVIAGAARPLPLSAPSARRE